jgi:hypothetical protein
VFARLVNLKSFRTGRLRSNVFHYRDHEFDELHCSKLLRRVLPMLGLLRRRALVGLFVDLSSVALEQTLFQHELFTYPWLENPLLRSFVPCQILEDSSPCLCLTLHPSLKASIFKSEALSQ